MPVLRFRKLMVALVAAVAFAFSGAVATTAVASTSQSTEAGSSAAGISAKKSGAEKKALKKCNKRFPIVSKKKLKKIAKINKRKVRKLRANNPRKLKRIRTANRRKVRKLRKRNRKNVKKRKNCVKKVNRRFTPRAPAITRNATFSARGSVGEAYVLDAGADDKLILADRFGRFITSGRADRLGSRIFYDIKPGAGYTVRLKKGRQVFGTRKFRVLKPGANPSQSFYRSKTLKEGLNYVTMRDGLELAMTVRLPPGKSIKDGPFPTVIEHSGYGTAAPHDLLTSVIGGTPDPLAPDPSTAVGALISPQMDFAAVSVQMRGSGCSAGAFDLFGLPTIYDGYDMVETVGSQSWAQRGRNGKGNVGMVGISFSGISQLFAAGTQPPHLAAIAPMSVTDDFQATGSPGGIFNKGFALNWINDRMSDAEPSQQPWARVMSTTGDPDVLDPVEREMQKQHCLKNQNLRLQTRGAIETAEGNMSRASGAVDRLSSGEWMNSIRRRSPGDWMKQIEVPTFLVGSFQDEQTGGHFPESLVNLKNNPNVWMILQSGVHVDSLGPSVITHWGDFIKLFVANEIPQMPGLLVGMSGMLYSVLADAPALPIKDSEYREFTNVDTAREAFRADNPRLRLLMDNGAATVQGPSDPNPGASAPGGIGAAWDVSLADWPVPNAKATSYFFSKDGSMGPVKPSADSVSYNSDPSVRPAKTLSGAGESDAWKAQPPYNWTPVAAGKGLGFTTAAMTEDTMIAGSSGLDLFLKSSATDTDIQVALSEVRPDGKETFIQSGWLRTSHRKKDGADLPTGKYTSVRVPIFPVAHMIRAGSKIRVTITAPGGDSPLWEFETIEDGTTENSIKLGGATPSKLVLPIVPGVTAQGTDLPVPTALRGQPSRTYETASNGG